MRRRELLRMLGGMASVETSERLYRNLMSFGYEQVGAKIPRQSLTTDHFSSQQIVAKDFRTAANVGLAGGPAGIRFNSSEIAGYSGGTTKEFYLQSSDGTAYFGGGEVICDSDGLKVKGEFIKIYDPNDVYRGSLKGDETLGELGIYGITTDLGLWAGSSGKVHIEGGLVINEQGDSFDTRIEGNTDTDLLLVDASQDAVGIGKTPGSGIKLDVDGKIAANDNISIPSASAYYVGANPGVSGSWTAGSGETVTCEKGIITSIV